VNVVNQTFERNYDVSILVQSSVNENSVVKLCSLFLFNVSFEFYILIVVVTVLGRKSTRRSNEEEKMYPLSSMDDMICTPMNNICSFYIKNEK
jgi:hypothetical protein